MKKLSYFFLLTFFVISSISAQDLSISWGQKEKYSNKADGRFKTNLGANSSNVYCLFNKIRNKRISTDKQLKIIAYNKQSLQKVATVALKGYPENKSNRNLLDKLTFYKAIIFDNIIYVFWNNDLKDREELYVQSFNEKLETISPLKKIFELTSSRSDNKKAEILVLGTKNNLVLIGGEKATQKENPVVFTYKLMKSDLSFVASNDVELPVKVTGRFWGLSSIYNLDEDGNLYLYSYVSMNKEEKKELMRYEDITYCIFSAINMESGAIKSYKIKYDGKNIYSLKYFLDKNTIKLYGFYSDLSNDSKGRTTQGIFSIAIDNKTFELRGDAKFTSFSQDEKNKLRGDEKAPDLRTMEILKIGRYNNNNILFCTKIYSYYVTTCNKNGCYTSYYCANNDIMCMSLNEENEINWLSNYEREFLYREFYVQDVAICSADNKYYITYADSRKIDSKRQMRVKKSKKERNNFLDYLVLNPENGKFEKSEIVVNNANTPGNERKFINAKDIVEKNNELFFNSSKIKMKPGAIVASVCLIPVFIYGAYIPSLISSSYYGTGFFGKIQVTK